MIFFNLLNLFWHADNKFCFYAEVNFWDFVRNDNSNKGTTARLNETRFVPKRKSSPIYLGPKYLNTFWCTGWAWNCEIIFRCASIHGRAGFILYFKEGTMYVDIHLLYLYRGFMVYNVYLGFFDKHGCTYWWIKKSSAHCKHVPCNTLTRSTNEELLNTKRKGDPKSRILSRTSDTPETRNPCVINKSHFVSLFYLY